MRKSLLVIGMLILVAGCNQTRRTEDRQHILITGSSTVFPFTRAVAEQFHAQHGQLAAPVVEATGTGPGFGQFCSGIGGNSPDIVNASRRMRPSEMAQCNARGIGPVTELQIGIDGVALVQSPAAPPIRLSRRQIYEALAATPYGQPNTRRRWKEIDPSLPDIPILVYGPPANDGTRDSLAELIMLPGCETNAEMRALKNSDERRFHQICTSIRTDGPYVASGENDEQTSVRLVVNPGAVGIFGYSYLEQRGAQLRGIAIDGVAPSAETIATGRYSGARPLYIYVKSDQAEHVPGLRTFVGEYANAIGPGGFLAGRGLIPATGAIRAQTAQAARTLAPLDPQSLRQQ